MKKAIIYFEGKEVTEVLFDSTISLKECICFFIKGDEVACFPINYGYVILDEITEEQKEEMRNCIKKYFTI